MVYTLVLGDIMSSFCTHLVIPPNVIAAHNKARHDALMSPCCVDPLDTESAIAAALEEWGFYMEEGNGRNRLIGPWMDAKDMNADIKCFNCKDTKIVRSWQRIESQSVSFDIRCPACDE